MSANGWFPVAASSDLPPGHIYQTMLDGAGLAIWRAASGEVNVWEDRCPHRGVRLSIGTAGGEELRCQYHAWRFASGSGACTFIPAHPGDKPPAAVRARIWPAVEAGGLVWTGTVPAATPLVPVGEVLRAIPVRRDGGTVEAALQRERMVVARFYIQPVAAHRCVIRGITMDPASLPMIDALLERLRRKLEAEAC